MYLIYNSITLNAWTYRSSSLTANVTPEALRPLNSVLLTEEDIPGPAFRQQDKRPEIRIKKGILKTDNAS
ncbi:Endonuclease MutS2 [Trichinella spiralis]|uniref:Endonuclease MutS2 n=1 Tax=Trichinella spiralis TaxID=6334 RepID=A0ABR3KV08_TRISP